LTSRDFTPIGAHALLDRYEMGLVDTLGDKGLSGATIQARVKTDEAIARKRARSRTGRVNDVFGLRVTVDHSGLLSDAADAVGEWADISKLELVDTQDYFDHPGAGGYRALHFDFAILNRDALGLADGAGVEVQITTALLVAIARVSHDLLYTRRERELPELSRELENIAREIFQLDVLMSKLARKIGGDR
jgi:ppGpp synthetase/RelA/SpoT-type nucleotidyltranferase